MCSYQREEVYKHTHTSKYIYIQGSPSRCGRREIPEVSQIRNGNVGKKNHVVLIIAEKSAGVLYVLGKGKISSQQEHLRVCRHILSTR